MSKGVPLPLAAAVIFGSCALAGAVGYYLAREQFKSPASADVTRPSNPAMSEVITKSPVKSPAEAVAITKPSTQSKLTPARLTEAEPLSLPTLQAVITQAEIAADITIEGEREATTRRIKMEIDANKQFYMMNLQGLARDTKGNPDPHYQRDYEKCGLVEMLQRSLLRNKTVRTNPGLQLAIKEHYSRSTKGGKLNLQEEVLWIINAWMTCSTIIQWNDITLGATNAAAHFKGESITSTRSSEAILVFKLLTKDD